MAPRPASQMSLDAAGVWEASAAEALALGAALVLGFEPVLWGSCVMVDSEENVRGTRNITLTGVARPWKPSKIKLLKENA